MGAAMVAWDAWKAEIRRLESTQHIDKTQISYLLYREICRILGLNAERSALFAVYRITGASFAMRTKPGELLYFDWLCLVDMTSGCMKMGGLDASYFIVDRVCTDARLDPQDVHSAFTEALGLLSAEGSQLVATWLEKRSRHRLDEI